MSRIQQYQSNFTVGELDPLLRGRIDLKQYYSAVSVAKNVIFEPQGGFSRRPGLKFVNNIPMLNNLDLFYGITLIPFQFSTTQNFLIVMQLFNNNQTNPVIRIFVVKNKEIVTLSTGSTSFNYSPGATSDGQLVDGKKFSFTQSADTLLIFHENLAPFKIQRGSADNVWSASSLDLVSPTHAFLLSKASANTPTNHQSIDVPIASGNITPNAVEGAVTIGASSSVFHTGFVGNPAAVSSDGKTVTLPNSANSTDDIYNGSLMIVTSGNGKGQKRVIRDYVGNTRVASLSLAQSGVFDGNQFDSPRPDTNSTIEILSHVGQFINVKNGFGRVKITEVSSQTQIKGITTVPFYEKDVAIPSGDWEFELGYETAWSDINGYARNATFHEGRLYIGGSQSLPNVLFGSKVGQFTNFTSAEGLDDDAIQVTLGTDSVNAINALRSGRDLQIFTTDAEFFVPQADLDPITPSNIVIKSATRRGSKANIRPQAAEGGTLFIQRQGKSLREMLFSDVELSYVANNISLLSSHLIIDPQQIALRAATDTTEGDLLLILNGTSSAGYRASSLGFQGGLAAFSLNKGQNIVAPSFLETDGEFKAVAVDLDDIYVIVKRTIGTGNSATNKYYLEVFDDDFTTDCANQTTGNSIQASQNYHTRLEGKTVKKIRDDILDTDEVVHSDGVITFSATPTSYSEVGLDYSVEVKTLPFEPNLPSGTVQSHKRRVVEVTPVLFRTQNVNINGTEISLTTLPSSGSGAVPTFTGPKKTMGFRGYDREAQITITQTKPFFLTVLSLDYKVAVGQ